MDEAMPPSSAPPGAPVSRTSPCSSVPAPATTTRHDRAKERKQPSSTSTSVEESPREDSGGAGNESDDEREPSGSGTGSGVQTTREDSDEQVSEPPKLHHHEMYPFPPMSHHQFQRHSSAEVEASSAGSASPDLSEDEEDEDSDVQMDEPKPIAMPKRTLSEYRASLSRAGLAAPPRIRRIGALGISVHSESDIENPQVSGLDTNDRIDPASGGDTSAGTRETDLGVSFATLQDTTGSGSQVGRGKTPRRRRRGVADATFRGIVDELAIENRQLKDRLRRYEAHGVPVDLKDSRLFEIRFYDGLPIDQRSELEDFLTNYVQQFVERGSPTPAASPLKVTPLPPVLNNTTLSSQPDSPVLAEGHASLPSPQESDRSDRHIGTQGRPLADASNSGVEPFSLSGVGSGVYRPQGHFPSHSLRPFDDPSRLPVPAILTSQDRELAKAVIASLEQLFRRSLRQNKEEEVPGVNAEQRSKSNETYMANFLSHDFLSDGWVYLNLASTMAELHRYSVTLNFVQQAVRDHSSNLEVSDDGKRVRWAGPSPSPSPPPAARSPLDDASLASEVSRQNAKLASLAPTDSQVSSGATTNTDGSGSSSNPSSGGLGSNQLANSIAPTASTAPTSQAPSKSHLPNRTKHVKPQRPTAAVLQRMNRLGPSDPSATAQETQTLDQASRNSPKRSPSRRNAREPPTALSFVAHPDSSMRQAPRIFHRLLRNKAEEDLEFSKEIARPGQSVTRGPGMLVYYANGHFCSDLTQEEASPHEVGADQPFAFGGFGSPPAAGSDYSDSPATDIDLDDEVDLLTFELGSNDGNMSVGEEGESSVNSEASSLLRLTTSGMTNTTPADLFTVYVKMNHPSKRTRHGADDASSNKRRRFASNGPRILSSKAYHHRPLMTKRKAPVVIDESSSGDESSRPHLTASNLAKHTHPTLAAITPPLDEDLPRHSYADTPSPPHDDYLLSLAAPLHAWAPRETNSVTQSPPVPMRPSTKNRVAFHRRLVNSYPARTISERSATTADERPISLDDPVGSGSMR
ncbi:hypothetical protein JCM11491_001865 [Sporobolomyces phaffii]